jgi:hypothetical protein
LGHRTRLGYSPSLNSIISSDENVQPQRRESPVTGAMLARSAIDNGFNDDHQRLMLAFNSRQKTLPCDCSSDEIISDGELERDNEDYASKERTENSLKTPVQDLVFRRQLHNDEQDIIDDETDTENPYHFDGLSGSACDANRDPGRDLGRFRPETTPVARNSSMFSIVSSSDDSSKPTSKIATRERRNIYQPRMATVRSDIHMDRFIGRGFPGISISDQADVGANVSTYERGAFARVNRDPEERARHSFGSIISDTSYMSGIIEDS